MLGPPQRTSAESCFDRVEGSRQLLAAGHVVCFCREEVALQCLLLRYEVEGRDAEETRWRLSVEALEKFTRRGVQRAGITSRRIEDPLTTGHAKVRVFEFDPQPPCAEPLVAQPVGDLVAKRQEASLEFPDAMHVVVEGAFGADTFVNPARLYSAVIETVCETPEVPPEPAEPSFEFCLRPGSDVLDARQAEGT